MGIFRRCQITLELDSRVSFKKKAALKKKIIDNDGIVSFIVTKKTTHLVVNNADKSAESYKGRMAQKYGIPIVSTSFVDVSVERRELVEPDDYLAIGKTAAEQFQTGKIIASQQDKENSDKRKKKQKSTISLNQLKSLPWPHSTSSSMDFNEDQYEVARYVFLKRFDGRSQLTTFASLEIHVVMDHDQSSSHYRIFLHHGTLEKKDKSGDIGSKCCYYLSTVLDTEHVFTLLYKQFIGSPHKMTKVTFLSSHVGSDKLKNMMLDIRSSIGVSDVIPADISNLVGYIWNEANGELNDVLSVPVEGIKLEQVEKAEAALLSVKLILDGTNKDGDVKKLTDDFYSAIPHKQETALDNKRAIAEKQDLCQLVRDVVSVGEGTNWSTRSSVVSKYRSLRCDITVLDHSSDEYAHMKQLIIDRQDNSGELIEVKNIYGVHRPVEDGNFTDQLNNKQLLFHSSPVRNFVGILSRGLLMPKIVVDDFGGTRTDPGMLGSGIYFASSSSVSSLYSRPGKTCGSRLMLVNQVALGNCMETTSNMMELSEAPTGYHSVHGVKSSAKVSSDFKGDEYTIYSTSQQRIRYLIEFSLLGDGSHDQGNDDQQLPVTGEEGVSEASDVDESANAEAVSLNDVKDIEDPLNKVEAGLVGGDIPLQSVHIKAKLIDLAAQVVVLQAYKNFSKKPIEAKYVFPLDDMAAVCGFEAFINGKHIVGEVKEKEQAHKEYREAISQGHGAYLMDEETPDVFTVSVGNLPPGASVLIKITYVAELLVEGENIVFSLPGSVAPWKKDAALDITTQSDVDKVKVTKQGDVSVQVAVEMPFKIKTIESPTHKLRIKKTATKAVIEMCEGDEGLGDGFQLLIGLAEIHVPRMWVEENDQSHHACMLTFYPEFEADCIVDNEIILCLDCSNSMKGDTLVSAKKVLLLILHHLPPKCLFNVITFGAAYDELFSSSQPKSKETVTTATNYIQEATATMGSTDVWRPLRSLLLLSSGTTATVDSSTLPPRNVFLVTDGHMTEEQPTLQAIRQAVHTTRLFTFGVGKTANRHFLKSMARVGAGYEEFFDPKTKSKWQRKVKSQLSKAFEPALTSVEVLWQQFDDNAPKAIQAPQEIVSLFSGSRQVIYGFVPHCLQATLKAKIGRKTVETMVSTSEMGVTQGKVLHQLTARAIIRDWTDGSLDADRTQHEIIKRDRKSYIINISKEYSIVSQFTSFVAIEKREKDETFDQSRGPSIAELVDKENVDMLQYISWEIDQSKDLVKICETSSLTFTKNLTYDFESLDTKSKLKDALHQITVEAHEHLPAELSEILSNKITSRLESDDFNYEEAQVFYLKVKGDYYRCLTQNVEEARKEAIVHEAHKAYKLASELASKSLSSTHPTRLAVALNFSTFYNEIMEEPEKACDLAKEAFDDAIAQLDSLHEDSYKDSTQLMQLLRDNLVLMQSDHMNAKDSLSQEGEDDARFTHQFSDQCAVESISSDISSYENAELHFDRSGSYHSLQQGDDSGSGNDSINDIGLWELDQLESDDKLPEDIKDESFVVDRVKWSPTLENKIYDEFERDESYSFTKAPPLPHPIFRSTSSENEESRCKSAIPQRPLPPAPLQKAVIDIRAAGPVDRSTKLPLTLTVESEHTVSPQSVVHRLVNTTKHKTCAVTRLEDYAFAKQRHGEDDICQFYLQQHHHSSNSHMVSTTSDDRELLSKPLNMPVLAASASVLAPSVPDDDICAFDRLSPDQDVVHFQQRIAITKSKLQSQPSDGREDYNKPVDEDGLKITMESYVCEHPPSAKVEQTYDHSQDVSEPGPPLRPPKQTIGAIEMARKLHSSTADITSSCGSEVPPPIPPKRLRRLTLNCGAVPPPLPAKQNVTKISKQVKKSVIPPIPLRNAVCDERPISFVCKSMKPPREKSFCDEDGRDKSSPTLLDESLRDDTRSFAKVPPSLPPVSYSSSPGDEELRRKSASARRPLPSTPLQKALTEKRVAGLVDRATTPPLVSTVVPESEHTVYLRPCSAIDIKSDDTWEDTQQHEDYGFVEPTEDSTYPVPTDLTTNDKSDKSVLENQNLNIPVVTASAALLAPSVPDDDIYSFDQLSPAQATAAPLKVMRYSKLSTTSDDRELLSKPLNIPVIAASPSVLAPLVSADDFDRLSPDQDVVHFQQRIAVTKSKPQSQPSDGREDYNKPVDEDGLKITTESYAYDHPPSVKVKRTYDRPQDVSEPGPPVRPPKQTIGAIEMVRKLPSPTAGITWYMGSCRSEVPPPLPPKRVRRSTLSCGAVPPPLPAKQNITKMSKQVKKSVIPPIPLRNAVSDERPISFVCKSMKPPREKSFCYQSSDVLGLEDGDFEKPQSLEDLEAPKVQHAAKRFKPKPKFHGTTKTFPAPQTGFQEEIILGEDFYQEDEGKELEYIPNETTVVQLFVIQETKTFSWKLSDLSLVNLDDVKLLKLLEDAGAKSLGVVVCQLLYSLVATQIIIFYLKKFLISTAVSSDSKIFDHNKFNKALEFSKLTNRRHPSLYKRLELGNSWEDAITRLIAICHV